MGYFFGYNKNFLYICNSMPDKIRIKQFKQDPNSFWVGFRHYSIEGGEIVLHAGGPPSEEHEEKLRKYLKLL